MLNYEVDASLLLPFVPAGTELDLWDGKAFVSLIGFQFLKTKLLGFLAIPLHVNFEEVNLRFYVRRQVGDEVRRGVVFSRELVPRRAIAYVARTFYNENYVAMPMAHDVWPNGSDGFRATYRWRNVKDWNSIEVETVGACRLPEAGSIEQFITEHYWGYAAQPDGRSVEYQVTHPSWRVWQVREATFKGDGEDLFPNGLATALRGNPASAFLAEGSAVSVRHGQRLPL